MEQRAVQGRRRQPALATTHIWDVGRLPERIQRPGVMERAAPCPGCSARLQRPLAVRVVAASRAGVHTCGLVVPATLKSGWQPAAVKASARNRGTATGMKHGHGMQGPAAWAP